MLITSGHVDITVSIMLSAASVSDSLWLIYVSDFALRPENYFNINEAEVVYVPYLC